MIQQQILNTNNNNKQKNNKIYHKYANRYLISYQ